MTPKHVLDTRLCDIRPSGPLDRREFIELATLGSAALLLSSESAEGAVTNAPKHASSTPANFGAFRPLAPGDVSPEGWLRLYLQKQVDQLGSQLPNVSAPFTGNYWEGAEVIASNGIEWWPWEQKAYWIDGALRCALTLRNEQLLQRALAPVRYTLDHALSDGYLGPTFARDATGRTEASNEYRWFHTVFFRALAAHGEATQDPGIAEALQRHYLADVGRIDYGGPSRNLTNIEGMIWAYERTGDRRLLAMAEKAWGDFIANSKAGDYEAGDLHPDRVFSNTPIRAHGITYIEKAKLPAILYMCTGKPEYLSFALAAQERIFSHHMLIDGIPSTSELYGQTAALDAHETCDITDHTWSWGYLMMATGDGVWADRIERACFNAGMGAIRKDWKGVQYFSCPNQVIATHDSDHVPGTSSSKPQMAYCPNPGHKVACCAGNVHRLFPNYVIRMWMFDPRDGGLAAVLYGASAVRAKVGANRQPIEVVQETNYPFGEDIDFIVQAKAPVNFPLLLRIPGWCKTPRLALNGVPFLLPAIQQGFVRLERTFRPGDRITLTLPMKTVETYWPSDGVGFERGPLVYAMPVQENWTAVVAPGWSTMEFPEWDARAIAPWNFGAVIGKGSNMPENPRVEKKSMTTDPWVEPPITLSIQMTMIPDWELASDAKYPQRRQTPPLPTIDSQMDEVIKKLAVQQVALIPYGATQLRLTIFKLIDNPDG